ncbi:protein ECT2-like [Zophobas morio]|uniref:protein ECT2-like n=1 Tax=Zophobas morio TaxID=2755281 RepID=UPI003083D0C4
MKFEKFAKFVNKLEKEDYCKRQSLKALLIQPVQRLPRYPLLLEALLKATNGGHPDYENIRQAIENISQMTRKVNDVKRQVDYKIGVYSLLQRIENIKTQTFNSQSRLLAKLPATLVGPISRIGVILFLLNDQIVVAATNEGLQKKLSLIQHVSIPEITLIEFESPSEDEAGRPHHIYRGDKLFGLAVQEERNTWLFESTPAAKDEFLSALKPLLQANNIIYNKKINNKIHFLRKI